MPGRAYDLARLWMVLADAPFETYLQASSMSDMERDLQQQDFRRFREAVHDHLVERARQQAEQFRIEDKARQWIELLESL
jgi:hypothetical protein